MELSNFLIALTLKIKILIEQ